MVHNCHFHEYRPNVRFGSKTEIPQCPSNVRFTAESRHRRVNNKSIVERDAELLLGAKAMQQNCCIAASLLLPKI
jgi:hypothetical protein